MFVVAKKTLALFITHSRIDQNQPITSLNEETPCTQINQVVFVCWIGALPDGLRDHTKHSTPVKFKTTCNDWE
jgi:hypothetical protein